MAYFRKNEPAPAEEYMTDEEPEYDDGFDELTEEGEEIPELSAEERRERNRSHVRLAMGAGNLMGVIVGTVLILVLLTLIFSIVHFVITDIRRSFSLFQTNF